MALIYSIYIKILKFGFHFESGGQTNLNLESQFEMLVSLAIEILI